MLDISHHPSTVTAAAGDDLVRFREKTHKWNENESNDRGEYLRSTYEALVLTVVNSHGAPAVDDHPRPEEMTGSSQRGSRRLSSLVALENIEPSSRVLFHPEWRSRHCVVHIPSGALYPLLFGISFLLTDIALNFCTFSGLSSKYHLG